MPARVVDLAEWRRTHPPIVRLWMAQARCALAWWRLFGALWR